MVSFRDRVDAGARLAASLTDFANRGDVIVLGLPRGGVVVAAEIAKKLSAPLDVFLVRKLGAPGHEELAMGALAEGGIEVLNQDVIDQLGISTAAIERVAARERLELERRSQQYRGGRPRPEVSGRVVVLVDDGLATGATMEAAVVALRRVGPLMIVAAVPVGAPDSCDRVRRLADRLVCLAEPSHFAAVGQWYEDFSETTDREVRELLAAGAPGVNGRA